MSVQEVLEAVVACDDRRIRAMIDVDIDRLRDLLSSRLVYTHAAGFSEDREAHLAVLATRTVQYLQFERRIERQVADEGLCLLHGEADAEVLVDGDPASVRVRFTSVWAPEDGGWRMLAWSAVKRQETAK